MTTKKPEPTAYGAASLTCAGISLFILGVFFGPAAAILGAIGIAKGTTKIDRTLSAIGLIAGIVFTIICLIALISINTQYRR